MIRSSASETSLSSRALFLQSCPCPKVGTTESTRARLRKFSFEMALRHYCKLPIIGLAPNLLEGYRLPVVANSATGFGDPTSKRRIGAPSRLQALFLCPHVLFMVAVRGRPSGLPGFLLPRFANPRTAATHIVWRRSVAAPQQKELYQ